MKEVKNQFPVYDICSLNNTGEWNDLIIAAPFAEYLLQHPNLHSAHRHNFYHAVLFTGGSGYHTIDFQQFPVAPGSMYFMVPGQVHSWNFSGEVTGYIVNFSSALLLSFLKDERYLEQFRFFSGIAAEGVVHLPQDTVKDIIHCFTSIIAELKQKDQFSNQAIGIRLLSIFIAVTRINPATLHKLHNNPNQLVLYNFRKLVDEHYSRLKLPKEYAELLYITPNHLNALCKDQLGKPAGEVIRDRVLLEAKRLLTIGAMSIAEIGYGLGFADNSYFTKFFRKYSGATPEAFRKGLNENTIEIKQTY